MEREWRENEMESGVFLSPFSFSKPADDPLVRPLSPSLPSPFPATNPRIREARNAMVTAVATVLAKRGVLFTLPPTGRAAAAVLAAEGEGDGDGCGARDGGGGGSAEDRQAALLFAAGRR